MSKHTPGPWRITEHYPMMVGEGIALQRGREIEHERETGEVFGLYLGRKHQLPMADLRLIAAAPELLVALREAIDGWADAAQYKSEYLAAKHGDFEDIARLRALLARIEGDLK